MQAKAYSAAPREQINVLYSHGEYFTLNKWAAKLFNR